MGRGGEPVLNGVPMDFGPAGRAESTAPKAASGGLPFPRGRPI